MLQPEPRAWQKLKYGKECIILSLYAKLFEFKLHVVSFVKQYMITLTHTPWMTNGLVQCASILVEYSTRRKCCCKVVEAVSACEVLCFVSLIISVIKWKLKLNYSQCANHLYTNRNLRYSKWWPSFLLCYFWRVFSVYEELILLWFCLLDSSFKQRYYLRRFVWSEGLVFLYFVSDHQTWREFRRITCLLVTWH